MAIIETKYNIGDIVYHGDTSYVTHYIECPDCLGTKIVHITFADKRVEEMGCFTCRTYGFPEYPRGSLDYKIWQPMVRKGTVTSVEFSQGKASYKVNYGWDSYEGKPYESICHEDEDRIHSCEEAALIDATEAIERHTASELENIFKKKGSFADRVERSHLRYNRQEALKEERDMKRWVHMIKGK